MAISTIYKKTVDLFEYSTSSLSYLWGYYYFFTDLCGDGLPSGWRVISSVIPEESELIDGAELDFDACIDTGRVKFYIGTTRATHPMELRVGLYLEESDSMIQAISTASIVCDNYGFFVRGAISSQELFTIRIEEISTEDDFALLFFGPSYRHLFVVGNLKAIDTAGDDTSVDIIGIFPYRTANRHTVVVAYEHDTPIRLNAIGSGRDAGSVGGFIYSSYSSVASGYSGAYFDKVRLIYTTTKYFGELKNAVIFRPDDFTKTFLIGNTKYISLIPYIDNGITTASYSALMNILAIPCE